MAVTVASIKVKHPEFGSTPNPRVQLFLDDATLRVAADQWGSKADMGIIELACHLMQKANDAEEAEGDLGPITSESVGDISVDYANPQSSFHASYTNSDLGTTSYGRAFLTLRREIFSSRVL